MKRNNGKKHNMKKSRKKMTARTKILYCICDGIGLQYFH